MEKVRYGEYQFHRKYWAGVSDEAKLLISRMLTVDVSRRITAADAMESEWIINFEEERKARKKKKSASAKAKKAKKQTAPAAPVVDRFASDTAPVSKW
jgi:serine/threonine protein kinase